MDFIAFIPLIFNELVQRIDVRLLPFVGIFFILGYWLKRMRLPAWCPKVPMLMFISGFITFAVYSAVIERPEAWIDAVGIVAYGLANSLFFVSIAVWMYDAKHQHSKGKAERTGGKG